MFKLLFCLRTSLSQAIDWESSDEETHQLKSNTTSEIISQESNVLSNKSSKRLNFDELSFKDNNIAPKKRKHHLESKGKLTISVIWI